MKRLVFISLFSLLLLSGSLTLTSVAAAPSGTPARVTSTPVCSSIVTNTTWLAISSPFVICNNASIAIAQGVTLTIEPGVEVQFGSNSRLNANGTLSAIGTASAPITFTGVVTTPGSWQGIGVFGTLNATNRSVFDHVVIEYAGINVSSGSQLHLEHAAVTLKNSLLRHGKQHGVYGAAKGMADIFDTAFEDHPGYAVYFSDGVVNPVLRRLTASGNGTDGVGLGGFASLTGVHVWEDSGLPYVWAGGVQVALGATLIVEPGVEVQFRQNQFMQVAGKLTAIGQPDRPITFTGSTKTIGWWGGLDVNGDVYNPASAQFDYVTFEYGGIGPNGANLLVTDGQASVAHSIIRYGSPHGVSISARGTGTVIESSQIISHAGYGVRNTVTGPAYAVNAANNWWGHPSGPQTDDGCNVGGVGTRVSPNVIFRPVLTDALALPPIVAPTEARILSLSPRRWFAPADGATRVYFDLTLRDGNGLPLSGRRLRLASTLGTVVDGGITGFDGRTLAYLTSSTPGDADVVAVIDDNAACETARAPSSRITFTPPVTVTDDLLPHAAAPYVNADIKVAPMPVVRGVPTTIQGKLTNSSATTITVDVTFAYVQSSIGLAFGPLATITDTVIPAHSTVTVAVPWTPAVSGHYCVQLIYTVTSIGARRITAPTQGGTSHPLNLNSYSAPLGSPPEKDSLNKARDAISTINAFTGPGSKPFNIPKQGVNILIGRQFDAAEKISQGLGFDPPRQDYNQITVPPKPTFTPWQPDAELTAAEATALNALTASMMDVYHAGRAATISLDRYGGAAEAHDLQWSTLQANALLHYKQLMGTALITAALRLDEFHQVLIDVGRPDVIITAAEVISYQQRLATQGFTPEEIAAAHQLGLTDEEIEASRQAALAADPAVIAGSSQAKLVEMAEAFRELSDVLLNPPNFPLLGGVGGSGRLAATTGDMPNLLVRVFESTSTILVGNPLTQTATIELRVRRVALPADWTVAVSPAQVTLAPGEQITATVSIVPGSTTVQGIVVRAAVEGYIADELIGGVAIDTIVPRYRPFDGQLHVYLPLIRR